MGGNLWALPEWLIWVLGSLTALTGLFAAVSKWRLDDARLTLDRAMQEERQRLERERLALEQEKAEVAQREADTKAHSQALDGLKSLCQALKEQNDRQETRLTAAEGRVATLEHKQARCRYALAAALRRQGLSEAEIAAELETHLEGGTSP